jgi:hypothetical protein
MRWLPLAAALIGVAAAWLLRRTSWGTPALWGSRIAYALLVLQAPFYFFAKGGYQVSAPVCQWTFDAALAAHSLTNYPHVFLFAVFFLLSHAQLPGARHAAAWSAAATVAMGLLVELAQGTTGEGHCRMRDLIPDSVGALIGFAMIGIARTVRGTQRAGGAA